jgi:hypothetical protein
MNYKIILLFIISLANESFAIDNISNLEFIELCDTIIEAEQMQSAMKLKNILNQNNYLDVIKWLHSEIAYGLSPIRYAIAAENLFIAKTLVDYITYDPNKQRPFSYTNGSISEHTTIAKMCYDPVSTKLKILKQCSLGNAQFLNFLCAFFSNYLSKELLMEAITRAKDNNQRDIIPILTNYLVECQYTHGRQKH